MFEISNIPRDIVNLKHHFKARKLSNQTCFVKYVEGGGGSIAFGLSFIWEKA
jgi:hypothetical protein